MKLSQSRTGQIALLSNLSTIFFTRVGQELVPEGAMQKCQAVQEFKIVHQWSTFTQEHNFESEGCLTL